MRNKIVGMCEVVAVWSYIAFAVYIIIHTRN